MAVIDSAADPPTRRLDALPRFDLAWDLDEERAAVTIYSPRPHEIGTQWISIDAACAVALDAIA